MKKTLTMRLLAIVLCVAMLATVTPIFAAAEAVITEIAITDADVTPYVGLYAGNCLNYTLPADCHFSVLKHYWLDDDTDQILPTDTSDFLADHMYSECWMLRADTDYTFDENATVTINGSTAVVDTTYTYRYNETDFMVWTLSQQSQDITEISSIAITDADVTPYDGVYAGNCLNYTLPADCHFTVTTHYWYDEESGDYLPDEVPSFVKDREYSECWRLKADTGYVFDENATVTINGSTAVVDTSYTKRQSETEFSVWMLPQLAQEITEISAVDITDAVVTPTVGMTAGDSLSCTLPEHTHFGEDGRYWYQDSDPTGQLSDTEVFKADTLYSTHFTIEPDVGYAFADDVVLTLNGSTEDIDASYNHFESGLLSFWTTPREAQGAPVLESGINLLVGKTWVTGANAADVLGDGTVSYDDETKTLTLDNANIDDYMYVTNAWAYCSIYADQYITIDLVGDNVVGQRGTTLDKNCYAIEISGSGECPPVLTGDGNLEVYAADTTMSSTALYEYTSDMEIAATGNLYFEAGACGETKWDYSHPIASTATHFLYSGANAEHDLLLVSGKELGVGCKAPRELAVTLYTSPEDPGTEAPASCFNKNGELSYFFLKEGYLAARITAVDTPEHTMNKVVLSQALVEGTTIYDSYFSCEFYVDGEISEISPGVTCTYYKTEDPSKPLSEWAKIDSSVWDVEPIEAKYTYALDFNCYCLEGIPFDKNIEVIADDDSMSIEKTEVSASGDMLYGTIYFTPISNKIDKLQYEANLVYGDYFYLTDYKREFTLYSGTREISDDIVWTDIYDVYRTDDPSKPFDEWEDLYDADVYTFEKGYSYKVRMAVTLPELFTFADDLKVETMSGDPVDFEWGGNDTQVIFWMDVTLSDPPASKPLTVSVEMNRVPYGGDKIGDVGNDFTMTYDADEADVSNYNYSYCAVSDDPSAPIEDWDYCPDEEKFEAGRSYAFRYYIGLNPDKYNDKTVLDTATLTINGKEPDLVDVDWEGNTYIGIYVVFPNIEGLPELPYNLIVGDTIVTADNAADIFGDGTASYDSSTNTLTLDNADITTGYEWQTLNHYYASIYADGDLNLVVKGDSKITSEAADMVIIDAMYIKGDLTISGDGDLTAVGGKADSMDALYCDGDVTIYAEGNYTFKSDDVGARTGGLYLYPNTVGATVTFEGTTGRSLMREGCDYYDFDIVGDGETIWNADGSKKKLVFTAVENTDYDLTVGNVTVDETNKDDIFGDGTASYEPKTYTLTLNNATIDTWSDVVGDLVSIYSGKPLNVVLVGDNVIDMTFADSTTYSWGAAVECCWDVTVTGDGNLTLKADNIADEFDLNGIWAYYNIDFQIGGDFTVIYGDHEYDGYVLYSSNGGLTYSAKNTSISIGDSNYANPFCAEKDISIKNTGNFTLTVGETEDGTDLVYSYSGKVFIENTGTMTLTSDKSYGYNYGIDANEDCIILNDGDFTLDVGDGEDSLYGIDCENLSIVSNKALTVKTGESKSNGCYALYADNKATFMCSGTVDVEAGDSDEYSHALCAEDIQIAGDAKYTFKTGDSASGYTEGIYATSLRIGNEADVTVDVGLTNGNDYNGYGICADDVVVTDAATLDVTVAGAPNGGACGVNGYYSVEFSTAGSVSVKVGDAAYDSYGIFADDCLIGGTAEGNTVSVEAKTAAFYYVPRYVESAYKVTGNLNAEDTMEDITAEDITNCKKVLFTALKDAPMPSEGGLIGDANDDGAVNMKDVLVARKYLAGLDPTINLDNADCNGDGAVNMKDVLLLRKFLAGLIEGFVS